MTTDQANPMNRNPNGRGGFGDNPQNRNPGGWKKENTARYKLELLIQMSDSELDELIANEDTPRFDKNMAEAVREGKWREIDSMINQVYGKPKESVDVTTQGESINPYAALTTDELRKLAKS